MIYLRKSFSKESLPETEQHVREHLSACCSATDDPKEFSAHVLTSTEEYPDGSIMVTGNLPGHGPKASYFHREYADIPTGKSSTVHEPVDLTPEELQSHLEKKFGVTS